MLKLKDFASRNKKKSFRSEVDEVKIVYSPTSIDQQVKQNQSEFSSLMSHSNSGGHEDTDSIWLISYSDLMTLLFGFFVMLMSFSKIDIDKYEKTRRETSKYFGGEYKIAPKKLVSDLKKEVDLSQLSDQLHFDVDAKGVTVTFRGALFFDAGSAELKPEAKNLLKNLSPIFQKQGEDTIVVVEGHTDDNPISDVRFPSNWELSSFRASSVLRVFEQAGFKKANLRAIGFGETQPALPNRDKAGKVIPANQSQNRRVVLRVIKSHKDQEE